MFVIQVRSPRRSPHLPYTALCRLNSAGRPRGRRPTIGSGVGSRRAYRTRAGLPSVGDRRVDAERDLSARALQLGRYTAALFVVAGELNQMKSSDRRLLYGHLIAELRVIAGASRGLATTLGYSAMRRSTAQQSPFYDLVNADRRIVDNILRQLEELGR